MTAIMARTETGAIIGIDFRRSGLSDVVVPGLVVAEAVTPGDTLRMGGEDVLVMGTRANGTPGSVYIRTQTAGGAEIIHELRTSERVRVVAVGAFDHLGPQA